MSVADFAFYVFAVVAVVAGLLVVTAKNPVHSVLWLILTFLSATGLFVLLGAEFLAMLLMIVYVGAVMVLFLFVVMMLDVDFAALKAEMVRYFPLAAVVGVVILMQLGLLYSVWNTAEGAAGQHLAPMPDAAGIDNTTALGMILFDQYFLVFQIAGLILLVAMIGAIVLTLRRRTGVKRQNVHHQMWRDPAKAMELKDVKPGQGL